MTAILQLLLLVVVVSSGFVEDTPVVNDGDKTRDGIGEAFMGSALPTGRFAIVEFKAKDPRVPIKPMQKMSEHQERNEFEGM